MQKITALGSIILGVFFLTGCATKQPPIQNQPTSSPAPIVEQPMTIQQMPTNPDNQNLYTNSEYGFQLDIPSDFGPYKTMVEKNYGGEGVTFIHFIFPTKDKTLDETNSVTHEKFPGHISLFAFTIYTKDAHAEAVQECKKNPTPSCPSATLGENKNYIFTAIPGNGGAPDDLKKIYEKIATGDIGVILNFKVIN